MKRNHNLELRLLPPSTVSFNSDNDHHGPTSHANLVNGSRSVIGQSNQPLTIFYNGWMSVCHVTEFQARSIISLASQERDDNRSGSTPSSPVVYSPNTGLSMKRSLQQFLQKRRNRIQATSPYH